MSFKNRVVFLTGAASGIGFEIAKQFAEQGASVVLSDLDTGRIDTAVAILKKIQPDVRGVVCDVTKEDEVAGAIDKAYATHGRIDILINSAGLQYVSPIEDFPVDKFELLIRVMLVGSFITIKKVFPLMKKQAFGRIINIASVNGLIGFAGKAAYNSAKHGLIGLTKVAALEAAEYDITVNALCPGYVDTPLVRNQLSELSKARNISIDRVMEDVLLSLVPQKRLLTVEEVADYALFLANEKTKAVTGQAVVIDGGYTVQ